MNKCDTCNGEGYVPVMYNDDRVYSIEWNGCKTCNKTGNPLFKENGGQKGKRGATLIGYIPEGQNVPDISQYL